MKAVLMSVAPIWCNHIIHGRKEYELRKGEPTIPVPFRCYLYCTNRGERLVCERDGGMVRLNGKVIGTFLCDRITKHVVPHPLGFDRSLRQLSVASCMEPGEMYAYANSRPIYAWHISKLQVYDEPKDLVEFYRPCIMGEIPYCTSCKKGHVEYNGGVETAADMDGSGYDTYCMNYLYRGPQSWCYVEEL